MPINKLTILLLLVLAADAAVALLLVEDLREYRNSLAHTPLQPWRD